MNHTTHPNAQSKSGPLKKEPFALTLLKAMFDAGVKRTAFPAPERYARMSRASATVSGEDVYALIDAIAVKQDREGSATRPWPDITLSNAELRKMLGNWSERRLLRARDVAVSTGWLRYQSGRAARIAGIYSARIQKSLPCAAHGRQPGAAHGSTPATTVRSAQSLPCAAHRPVNPTLKNGPNGPAAVVPEEHPDEPLSGGRSASDASTPAMQHGGREAGPTHVSDALRTFRLEAAGREAG